MGLSLQGSRRHYRAVRSSPRCSALGGCPIPIECKHGLYPSEAVTLISKQIAVGDLNTYNTLLESTADIAEYICRNALVESLLKDSLLPAADELSCALVKLYAAILGYLARAKLYYN